MTNEMMALQGLWEKTSDADRLETGFVRWSIAGTVLPALALATILVLLL